jgi:hypothetical protein
MKVFAPRWYLVLLVVAVGGCQDKPSPSTTTPADVEADIRVNLARLGPEDQHLAEQQKYCPMMERVRLGEMGRPHRIEVKGESVFVCCQNCARLAQEDPEMALIQIKELRKAREKALSDGASPATKNGVGGGSSSSP